MQQLDTGRHYAVKLVGILTPDQPGCALASLKADTELSDVRTPADLSSKGLGLQIIHSFQFLQSQEEPKPSTEYKPDSAEALQTLMTELQQAYATRDKAAVISITKGLLPDNEQLKIALAPNIAADVRNSIMKLHSGIPKDDESLLGLIGMRSDQTNVVVHSASTEQLMGTKPPSADVGEFPGGSIRVAKSGAFRAGMVFHEVEFLEPGKELGMKYHLFYWNGQSWNMLGPVWRSVSSPPAPAAPPK